VHFHICPKCGDVIGVYESFAWQMPDGSEITSIYVPRGTDVEAALDIKGTRLHSFCASED
jgi:hypothetical protein